MSNSNLRSGHRFLSYLALIGTLFNFIVYPAYAMVEHFPYGVRSHIYYPFVRPLDPSAELPAETVHKEDDTSSEKETILIKTQKNTSTVSTETGFEIYAAEPVGVIGYNNASGSDDPSDNIFRFEVDKKLLTGKQLTLSYDVYGIENVSGVARSINEHTATGGYFAQKSTSWKTVEEVISIDQLKQGMNHILFTTFENQKLDYKVKNLKLTALPAAENAYVHLADGSMLYEKDGKAYVKGTVLLNTAQLSINGNNVAVRAGEFETVLENASDIKSLKITLTKNGQSVYSEELPVLVNREVSDAIVYKAPEMRYGIRTAEEGAYHFALDNVDFKITAAQYAKVDQITVQQLREVDRAPLGTNIVNVTAGKSAYRFLPEGAKFSEKVPLTLAYDKNLLPKGYNESDIQVLYFDLQKRSWVAVETDTIAVDQQKITGLTDHFTDYMAGVIQAPESPETNSFTPTTISGIEAANPTAGIVQIQPPVANQKGDGTLEFPITLPPGRAGLEPNLSVAYNNNGSSGIVGYGWDIAVPFISVDTKFGVPKYDGTYETESYTFSGEDLVMKNGTTLFQPHRTTTKPARQSDAVFFTKVEGSFSKIQRMGSTPKNYSWVVTDKSGTKYEYIGFLKSDTGNIAKWYLNKVTDKNGNYMTYSYSVNEKNGGKEVLLSSISYNQHPAINLDYNTDDLSYKVTFVYKRIGSNDYNRKDSNFNYRYGFKEANSSALDYILVTCNKDRDNPERYIYCDSEIEYRFNYNTNGTFGKELLTSITTRNKKKNSSGQVTSSEDYTHSFEYYNDVQNGLFAAEKVIGLTDDFADDKHAVLSSTVEDFSSWEVNFGAGISPSANPPAWWPFSYGGTINFSFPSSVSTSSSPTMVLMDIDGDGLDDKVIKTSTGIKYHKNLGGIAFSSQLYKVQSLNNLGLSENVTKSKPAMSLSLIAGSYSASKSQTNGRSRAYFADVNADGLIDYVQDRIVYFNRIDPNSDLPAFTDNSALTPNLIFKEEAVDPTVSAPLPDLTVGNDLMDVVKVWVAPRKGHVSIDGTISKGFVASHNGVRYSVEKNGGASHPNYWDPSYPIKKVDPKIPIKPWDPGSIPILLPAPVNNYTKSYLINPTLLVTNSMSTQAGTQVEAGDHIYFRVNSSQLPTALVNVNWDPYVRYDDGSTPDEGAYYSESMVYGDVVAEPVVLFEPASYRVEFPNISNLGLTSDVDITVRAYQIKASSTKKDKKEPLPGRSIEIYKGKLKANSSLSYPNPATALTFAGTTIDPTEPETFIYVEVEAAAKFGLKLKDFDDAFIPTIRNLSTNQSKNIVPKYDMRNNALTFYPPLNFPIGNPIKIKHDFTVAACQALDGSCREQYIYMQARYEDGQILNTVTGRPAQFRYRINQDGNIDEVRQMEGEDFDNSPSIGDPFSDVDVEPGRNLFLEYTTDEYAVASALNNYQNNNNDLVTGNAMFKGPSTPIKANIATKTAVELGLGTLNRHWGQFAYLGAAPDKDFTPIEQSYVSRVAISGVSSISNPDPNEVSNMETLMKKDVTQVNYDFEQEKFTVGGANIGINQNQLEAIRHFTILRSNRAANAWSSHERLYVKESEMSPYLRYNNENEIRMLPIAAPTGVGQYGAVSIVKENSSESKSKGYSIGFYGVSIGTTNSSASSRQINDYMDVNGDGYPDIIGDKIQLTTYRGGLSNTTIIKNLLGTTTSSGSGRTAGGSDAHIMSMADPGGRFTKIAVGSSSSFSGNTGLGASVYKTNTTPESVLVDINGDGLVDLIKAGNAIELNTSDTFLPATWNGYTAPSLSLTTSVSLSANLGASFSSFSNKLPSWMKFDGKSNSNFDLSIGGSGSRGATHSKNDFVDFNGDGLPDYINDGAIFFNTGTEHIASGLSLPRLSESSSYSYSTIINASVLIAIALGPLPFVIKVGGGGGKSFGKNFNEENVSLRDFDGDGYVDMVESSSETEVKVRLSKIGRTNMLKKVINPTKSTIELDYGTSNSMSGENIGSTYKMPFKKWVLKTVTVYDGLDLGNDGEDYQKYAFEYENGYKDRRERKFLGFGKVRTHQLKANGAIYRTKEQQYMLDKMLPSEVFLPGNASDSRKWQYIASLPTVEMTMDAMKRTLDKTEYEYAIYSIGTSTTYGPYQTDSAPVVTYTDVSRIVPLLKVNKNTVYNFQDSSSGSSKDDVVRQLFKQYDKYGNLTNYTDDTPDQNLVVISYHDLAAKYIVNIPATHSVNTSDRYSTTTVDATNGNITEIKRYSNGLNSGSVAAVTTLQYNNIGNLIKVTMPAATNGQRMWYAYTYDPAFSRDVAKVEDAYGYTSETSYSHFGLPLTQTDLNRVTFRYGYDATRRLIDFKGPYNQDWTIRNEYKKDANGLYYAVTQHNIKDEAIVPAADQIVYTSSFADGLGRIIQTKKQLALEQECPGAAPGTGYRLATSGLQVYDEFGRITASYLGQEEKSCSANFRDGLEHYTPLQHVDQEKTSFAYDVRDRVLQNHVHGLNATTTYNYGFGDDGTGNVRRFEKVTLPEGNVSVRYLDEKNRLISTKQIGASQELLTKYTYDRLSQLTKVTDMDLKETLYEYDKFGQKIKTVHPDNGATRYTYDLSGKLATSDSQLLFTQSKKITYSYNYDQLTSIVYPAYTANSVNYPGHIVSYTYGANAAPDYSAGRITGITDLTGTRTMKYGKLGEVVEENRIINSQNTGQLYFKTSSRYDSWGRIMELTYPDGEKLNYTYNSVGQLKRIANTANEVYLKDVLYNFFDQPTRIEYGNDVVTVNDYDITQRIRAMKLNRPDATLFMKNIYSYDKNQNITGISNAVSQHSILGLGGTFTKTYAYDKFNRLSTADGTWNGANSEMHKYKLTMAYNNTHGIVQKKQRHDVTSTAFTGQSQNSYNSEYKYQDAAHPHAVSSITYSGIGGSTSALSSFTYDANGNMTKYVSNYGGFANRDMIWDQQNRLLAVIDDAAKVNHYVYDHAGERTLKETGTVSTVNIGGSSIYSVLNFNNYMIYPSGYLVADMAKGQYSKHYYINGKRFVSRLAAGTSQFSAPQAKGLTVDGISSDMLVQDDGMNFNQALGVQNTTYGIAIGNNPQNCTDQIDAIILAYESQNTNPQQSITHCINRIKELKNQNTPCEALKKINEYICEPKNLLDPDNNPDDTTPPNYTPGQIQQADCLTELNILISQYTAKIQSNESSRKYFEWFQCINICRKTTNIRDNQGCWEQLDINGVWSEWCSANYADCGCGPQPQVTTADLCPVLALRYIDKNLLSDLSNACAVKAYVETNFKCLPPRTEPDPDPVKPGDTNDNWTDGGGVIVVPGQDGPYDESKRKPIWWYHTDHLGSSTYLTDNFGRPTHYYETLPYGEMMVEQNQSKYGSGKYNNAYKFNGKELDDATGMYYYGARYYDPRISIFVSVDPLAEKTMTPYQYVHNNPINLIDPTGMSAEGGGGGWLTKLWNSAKSFIGIDSNERPNAKYAEDGSEILDEVVINTKPSKATAGIVATVGASNVASAAGTGGTSIASAARGGLLGLFAYAVIGTFGSFTPYSPDAIPYVESKAFGGVYTQDQTRALAKDDYAQEYKNFQGSYTIEFNNNKRYHGKGPFNRMLISALLRSTNGVLPTSFDWTPASSDREAFKAEYRRMQRDANQRYSEGYLNPINYNVIQSPGKKYIAQDGF